MMPRLLAVFLSFTLPLAAQAEPLRIVASIKPITLLATEVAPPDAIIHTLIPASASPHTYQMKPSDRRALAKADVILWVGPSLETFLQRLLNGRDMSDRAHALAPQQKKHHSEGHDHHHDYGDGHEEDPHLWVSPDQGHHLAERIAGILSNQSLEQAHLIRQRLSAFEKRLEATRTALRDQLSALQSHTLFIYHPAFQHFADHFGLKVGGTLTRSPEQRPGARHLSDVQEKLASADQPCLLSEVQFNDRHWQSLTSRTLPHATWDPLATTVEPGTGGYARFLTGIADALMVCKDASPQP